MRLLSAVPGPDAPSSWRETRVLQLTALLGAGVISWFFVLRAVGLVGSDSWATGLSHLLRDGLLTFALAFVAVRGGEWLAARWRIAEHSATGLLGRAALIALIFALLLCAAGAHQILDRAFAVQTHTFHGQPRGAEFGRAGGMTSIALQGLQDALLGYLAALPLMFLGLALRSGKNRDNRTGANPLHCRAQPTPARWIPPSAIALAVLAAGISGSTITSGKRIQGDPQAPFAHPRIVTSIPIGVAIDLDDFRVTVQSAQWVRQPRPNDPPGAARTNSASPDRIYLELTFENLGALPRSVGRAEFYVRGLDGARWAPLADDFPAILLGPAERLTTRLIFEVPPQTGQLELVSMAGIGEARFAIADDPVGGLWDALCRALTPPWKG